MILALCCLILFASSSHGIRCMTCGNARSHQECDSRGRMEECRPNQQSCAIEERKLNYGPDRIIFKSCKQRLACYNNYMQNSGAAWLPTQCNRNYPNSVCRCCCDSDECNVGPDKCFKKPPMFCRPAQRAPSGGSVRCGNRNRIGSVCNFACRDGYMIRGSAKTTCEKTGKWSNPAPTCRPITCQPPHGSIENGVTSCTRMNLLGSVCSFTCNNGYELVGVETSACRRDVIDDVARWSSATPTCGRISCPDQGELRNGRISCDNGNLFESRCNFECNGDPFFISPLHSTSNVCLGNGNWSIPPPCCARPCPPHAVFDFVMVLDSSSSVGEEGWQMTLNFTKSFVSLYTLSAFSISVFRYNDDVDIANAILLDNNLDQEGIARAIESIPYNGTGTNIGKALNYTREVIFTHTHGNRDEVRDVVLVITDGKSQDDVTIPSQLLRDSGTLTYAIGVVPLNGILDFDDLHTIGGEEGHVFLAEEGYDGLTPEFAYHLATETCGDPCLHADHDDF